MRVAGEHADGRPVWEVDGRDWPHREASRFVHAAGLRWHVQQCGAGPAILLVHGTGASTHSWAGLMPLLARHFTVVAVDLPGHGFTCRPPLARMALPAMGEALAGLLAALTVRPEVVVGHSAGAAILARMCLDRHLAPRLLFSLNGALVPFRGAAGHLFSPLARLVARSELLPRLFAWHAGFDRRVIERLVRDTGSSIGAQELELYRRLARRPGHVGAALAMMAQWDLPGLARDLPRLRTPLVLVVGSQDRTIPPADAERVRSLLPRAEIVVLPGLGHLAHEERPDLVAASIEERMAVDRP